MYQHLNPKYRNNQLPYQVHYNPYNGATPIYPYYSSEATYYVDQNGEQLVPVQAQNGGYILQSNVPTSQAAFMRPVQATVNSQLWTRECACPIGCQQLASHRQILLTNENDFLALECSNAGCQTNSKNVRAVNLVHRACVQVLETQLVAILKNTSLTHGFSDKERKSNLWPQFERWLEKCPEFRKLVNCRSCPLVCDGHLKLDQSFDVQVFIMKCNESFHSPQYTGLLPEPNNNIRGRTGSGTSVRNRNNSYSNQQNHNQPPVHKNVSLPEMWRVNEISGPLTGGLKDFGISEPWLQHDYDEANIDAVSSEIQWMTAKSKNGRNRENSGETGGRHRNKSENRSGNYQSNQLEVQNKQDSESNLYMEAMQHTPFPPRYNFSDLLHRIPVNKMNPYNIMMEAGGQSFGVDDLRTHILSNLSQCHASSLNCCLCDRKMPIYHHFPLVAGTLFLSSERNEKRGNTQGSRVQLQHNGKNTYMHGVCVDCLESNNREIKCSHCFQRWSGTPFQIGTLNSFDIFACAPCCGYRISCKSCKAPVLKKFDELQHFSQYSDMIFCKKCKTKDYHLVKPSESYEVIYKPEASVVKTGGVEVKSESGVVRPKRLAFVENEQSFGGRVVSDRRNTFSVGNNLKTTIVTAKTHQLASPSSIDDQRLMFPIQEDYQETTLRSTASIFESTNTNFETNDPLRPRYFSEGKLKRPNYKARERNESTSVFDSVLNDSSLNLTALNSSLNSSSLTNSSLKLALSGDSSSPTNSSGRGGSNGSLNRKIKDEHDRMEKSTDDQLKSFLPNDLDL